MSGSRDDISWGLVLVLLVPVVVALSLMGSVIYDSLAFGAQRADAPDATVLMEDHPDDLNRTTSGDGILTMTLRGDDTVEWRDVVVEIINPRSDAVVATLASPTWFARGEGQSIALRIEGARPRPNATIEPGDTFVLRELADDTDGSTDLVDTCQVYLFRVRYTPSDSVIGSREFAVVSSGLPGQPCEPSGS